MSKHLESLVALAVVAMGALLLLPRLLGSSAAAAVESSGVTEPTTSGTVPTDPGSVTFLEDTDPAPSEGDTTFVHTGGVSTSGDSMESDGYVVEETGGGEDFNPDEQLTEATVEESDTGYTITETESTDYEFQSGDDLLESTYTYGTGD